jgi:ferredoxin
VCPVKAILDSIDLEPAREHWVAVNQERAKALPVVRDKAEPLPTAAAKRESLGF